MAQESPEKSKATTSKAEEPSFLTVGVEGRQLVLRLDWVIILCILAAIVVWVIFKKKRAGINQEIDSVTIKFGGLPEAVIKINRDTQKIAFSAYTELVTRKIALPFDQQYDVIEDVYKSWYQVFSTIRELIKQIPAHHITTSDDTRKLVQVLINLLNNGLRPHLTKWHAQYRRWYEIALREEGNRSKSPQEIQREYPKYGELVADMKGVNADFQQLASQLRNLAEARKTD